MDTFCCTLSPKILHHIPSRYSSRYVFHIRFDNLEMDMLNYTTFRKSLHCTCSILQIFYIQSYSFRYIGIHTLGHNDDYGKKYTCRCSCHNRDTGDIPCCTWLQKIHENTVPSNFLKACHNRTSNSYSYLQVEILGFNFINCKRIN